MNKIKVIKESGFYWLQIDGADYIMRKTAQEIISWLDFNWPSGTRVQWVVRP